MFCPICCKPLKELAFTVPATTIKLVTKVKPWISFVTCLSCHGEMARSSQLPDRELLAISPWHERHFGDVKLDCGKERMKKRQWCWQLVKISININSTLFSFFSFFFCVCSGSCSLHSLEAFKLVFKFESEKASWRYPVEPFLNETLLRRNSAAGKGLILTVFLPSKYNYFFCLLSIYSSTSTSYNSK